MAHGSRTPALAPSQRARFTTISLLFVAILSTAHRRASDTELADTVAGDFQSDQQFVGAVVHVDPGVDALSQIRLHLESDDGKWYTLLPEIVRRHE